MLSKSGHAFIKEKMREVDGVYGGEMSAHHYFKEFSYCDSGMIPWLQVAEAMSEEGRPLSAMVEERIARYPVSGEINLTLPQPARALAAARARYAGEALSVDETDGVSVELAEWRFNVRSSNTEPVVRVNVEARGDKILMEQKTQEVLDCLERSGVRIALAQINPTVGDIKGNTELVIAWSARARAEGARRGGLPRAGHFRLSAGGSGPEGPLLGSAAGRPWTRSPQRARASCPWWESRWRKGAPSTTPRPFWRVGLCEVSTARSAAQLRRL